MSSEEAFIEACTDVVVRFVAHDQYRGDKHLAADALERRQPGHQPRMYLESIERYAKVYAAAVRAVRANVKPDLWTQHALLTDIDFEGCIGQILAEVGNSNRSTVSQLLNWVIYWHYLR